PANESETADNTLNGVEQNPTHAAIYQRGVLNPIRGVKIRKNQIHGVCAAAVQVTSHGDSGTGDISVEDNQIEGPRSGVVFENGSPRVRPVIDRNVFRGMPPELQVVGTAAGFSG